jgi:transposase-like protein
VGKVLTPKTHCKHGHEFTEENTYRAPSRPDRRMCRECLRETNRRLRREHPERYRVHKHDTSYRSTLTAVDVRELIRMYEDEQLSMKALAKRFGVQAPQVSAIINGRSWKSVTGGVNRSRHANPGVPDRDYRSRIEPQVDEMVARLAAELNIDESEVRRHLRRIFHPKREDRN